MSKSVIDTLNDEINRLIKEYGKCPEKIILPQRVLNLFVSDVKDLETFSGKSKYICLYPDVTYRHIKLEGDENIKDWIWVWPDIQ